MASESPAGEEGPKAQPTRRSIMLRIALLVAIVGFVFVVLLPRVVDYDGVRAALAGLTAGQLAALVGATTVAYVLNAGPARVLVPGLTWRRAVEADLVGRAVASTIPGPSDVAIKSVLFGQVIVAPGEGAFAVLFVIGYYALFAGVTYVAIGLRLRGLNKTLETASTSAGAAS